MANNRKFYYKEVADALVKSNGLITHAAKMLGCEYHLVSRYIKQSALLKKVVQDIKEDLLDLCENHIHTNLVNGDMDTIKFYIRYFGRERGYYDKPDININIDVSKLTDSELDYLLKTGKLPSTVNDISKSGEGTTEAE